jgi:HEAT repeat protein
MFRPPPLPRTLEAALRDAGSASAAVRASAVRDVVDYASESRAKVLGVLRRALTDVAAEVRSAAAVALADVKGVEVLGSLLVAVEDDDAHVRQMALSSLGEIGDSRARERLRRALRDDRPEVRFQAVIAFARVAPDEATDEIAVALDDDDPSIRYIAIRCAEEGALEGDLPIPEHLLAKLGSLLADPNSSVRIAAAIVLARGGDRRALPILVDVVRGALSTPEAEDEAAAVELVGELGVDEARPHLERRAFGFLRLGSDRFAWQAMVALARMGHPRARSQILRDLGSWSRDKRTLAVAAAGRARVAEALPLVRAMKGDERRAEPSAVDLTLELLSQGDLSLPSVTASEPAS